MKVKDIGVNPDVALTVYKDYSDLLETRGLEYAGKAEVIETPAETRRIIELLMDKFPSYRSIITEQVLSMFPSYKKEPGKSEFVIIKVTPKWIRYSDAKTGFETLSF